jgi:hypothetical protein
MDEIGGDDEPISTISSLNGQQRKALSDLVIQLKDHYEEGTNQVLQQNI